MPMSYLSRYFSIVILLFFCSLTAAAQEQKTIHGTVIDAGSGETLPSANISIEGTYRGTISNINGDYTLSIPDSLLPATVVVRYIGFESQKRAIGRTDPARQDFHLKPSVTELAEIVVTDEDPALGIMREVIRRKQQWRQKLDSYRAEAYTRQSLSNDTSIVMITESISVAWWKKGEGHREVLKSRKQTANIPASDNFAGVSYLPNFYDDNIDIAGFELVGVTHPDALKFYHFKLVGQTTLDGQRVYEIEVRPRRKLQPLFEGTIYVLDLEYALLEVDLQPNEVVTFPTPIKDFNTFYKQQFNNFGQEFWLPVDMRIEGDIKIQMIGLEFPLIRYKMLSRIANYEVNIPVPDSLYERNRLFSVDSTTIQDDSLFVQSVGTVPLSNEEEEAYSSLDSTATLEKAFQPTGFFSRFVDVEDDGGDEGGNGILSGIPGEISPVPRYNRVDELYAGLKYSVYLADPLRMELAGGYSTGYEEWSYGASMHYRWFSEGGFYGLTGAGYEAVTQPRYNSQVYSPGFTVVTNLMGQSDYYDYYRKEAFRIYNRLGHYRTGLMLQLGFKSEKHRSLPAVTAYDLLGEDNLLQFNPPVDEGRLNALILTTGYNLNEEYSLGVTGLKRIRIDMEYSGGRIGSDFDYILYRAAVDWSFPTFYNRRFFPNTLDLKLYAGTHTGTLPIQKFGIVDGALQYFSPFGSLKTIRNRPYEGSSWIGINAEHNFRTIPFELLGLRPLVDRNIGLIVFGGAARTRLPGNAASAWPGLPFRTASDWHLEAGLAINGLFGLFRVDLAQRLDEPAFTVNVSVARLF